MTNPIPEALQGRDAKMIPERSPDPVTKVDAPVSSISWLAIGCVALGCFPILIAHFLNLVAKPHYQFAVLVPLAVWFLWSQSDWDITKPFSPIHPLPLLLLVVFGAGLAVSTNIWSPWLGAVCALFLVWPCMWWRGGWAAWEAGWRGWIVACTMLPLPFGMDEDLTVRLRGLTTKLTSHVLDVLQVKHLSYANVIELPGKPLFIADACSGIHSLYVLMAAAVFYAMWIQRSLIHTIFLVCATAGIVLWENITRLTVVAYTLRFKIDLSEGFDHTLLGGVLFCVSLLLMVSTDQFLMFLLPGEFFHFEEKNKRSKSRSTQNSKVQWTTALTLSSAFLIVAVLGIVRMPKTVAAEVFVPQLNLPQFGSEALPTEIGSFSFENYQTIQRVPGDPLGRDSRQWMYRYKNLSALVSLDTPYEGLHDLCECYHAIGWTIPEKRVIPVEELSSLSTYQPQTFGPVAEGHLQRELYGNALLYFSLAGRDGQVGALIKELAKGNSEERAGDRLRSFTNPIIGQGPGAASNAPYIQFQVLARTDGEFSEDDEELLLEFYLNVRDILISRCFPAETQNSPTAQKSGEQP